MHTFNLNVIRTDSYKIEIDEQIWNEQALKDWGSVFHRVDTVADIAKHLAICLIRQGYESFIEGYGYIRTFYHNGTQYTAYKEGFKPLTDDEYCKGIRVTLGCYDDDYDVEF